MISKTERKRLKKILGNMYSEAVTKELARINAVNKFGNPYSHNQIRVIFNGGRSHAVIEDAIYKVAKNAIASNSIKKLKRNKILKSA